MAVVQPICLLSRRVHFLATGLPIVNPNSVSYVNFKGFIQVLPKDIRRLYVAQLLFSALVNTLVVKDLFTILFSTFYMGETSNFSG